MTFPATTTDVNLPPVRPPQRKRGSGCWLVAFASLFIAAGLVALGMMLPPFNLLDRALALQFTPLDANNPILDSGAGLLVSIPPETTNTDFGLRILPVASAQLEEPPAELPAWTTAARNSLPHFLALQGPLFLLEKNGTPPQQLQFDLALERTIGALDELSLYGWDGGAWRFIPSTKADNTISGHSEFFPAAIGVFRTSALPPIVMASQEITQALNPERADILTILSPAGLRPSPQGGLIGSLAPGGNAESNYLYMPLIRNFADERAVDTVTVERLIVDPALRRAHVSKIVNLAEFNGFHGVVIDYRDLPRLARGDFSGFIESLGDSLRKQNMQLGIVIPAALDSAGDPALDAYDWRALGAAVDYVKLDVSVFPPDFGPVGDYSLPDVLGRAVQKIDRYKILLGLSLGFIQQADDSLSRVGYHSAIAGLGDVKLDADEISETGSVEPGTLVRASLSGFDVVAGRDDAARAPYLDFLNAAGQAAARVWLTDSAALRFRMDQALSLGLAGVAFDDLLGENVFPGLLKAIREFKAQMPAQDTPSELALRWSVHGSDGKVDDRVVGLSENLVLTLDAPDGNYAINAAVIDTNGDKVSQRGGAVLPLFRATATLTPTPTPTPTPSPTPRPAPVVIAAPTASGSISAPSGGGFAAVAPPPGSIHIEIGGHVTGTGSHRAIGAMRAAGMTWMKIQARFYQNNPPDVAHEINTAHNNGFKILVGTVGNPRELDQGGQAYVRAYTDWLARIAGQGADSIEVWNEPNLDREWPFGKISGADYAQMLIAAYQKIKSANAATMVISAAPAPTGAENAFPGQVMNDDRWLREMVAGGALNALDCVGAHYNEGIIPPSQTSGDPRQGEYYTRYFYGMLNTYYSITGRPICFTELGYLTSDGFPALSEYFSWADNVTIAQQAAWLAEAAALASQSGQVRLLIVWNVDFTHFGADPQAGFAMIRRDGSCPACDALGRAR